MSTEHRKTSEKQIPTHEIIVATNAQERQQCLDIVSVSLRSGTEVSVTWKPDDMHLNFGAGFGHATHPPKKASATYVPDVWMIRQPLLQQLPHQFALLPNIGQQIVFHIRSYRRCRC